MRITPFGILTALFFATLPFFVLPGLFYPDINSKFFLSILFIDGAILFATYQLYASRPAVSIGKRWILAALILTLVALCLSAVFGVFPARSFWSDIFWSSGVIFLTHCAIFAILLAELLTKDDWSLIRRAIAISGAVLGALTIFGVNGMGYLGRVLWVPLEKGSLVLGNETYAGAYLVLAFLMAMIEFARTKSWTRWSYGLIVATCLIALSPLLISYNALSGGLHALIQSPFELLGLARASSAALFSLILFLVGYGVIKRVVSKKWSSTATYIWGALLIAVIGLGIILLFVPGSVVQNKYIEESTAARIIIWNSSIEAFKDRPVFGWGPENFGIAVESHFDTRLYYEENNGEIWFERAHNAFLDALVATGVTGTAIFTLLVLAILFTVHRARKRELIGDMESFVLLAFPFVHLIQTQTGFDTIGSYLLLTAFLGYVLSLEKEMVQGVPTTPVAPWMKNASIGLLVFIAFSSVLGVLIGEYARQSALFESFKPSDPAIQKVNLEESLTRTSSFESLRFSSGSFIKGSLGALAKESTPERIQNVLAVAAIYEQRYQAYLAVQPNHYRARMNYAYLLLIETTLGTDRTAEAKAILKDSYKLSPNNPITPVLDSVTELYKGNLKEADRLMGEALAIDPEVEFTQEAAAYLKRQEKRFPNLDVLKLTNL